MAEDVQQFIAQLGDKQKHESRSARERADHIRELVSVPKGKWSSTTVF